MQMTPPPVWKMLRLWEWYKVHPKWKYAEGESIIVQTYTNCEEAELFLNGASLGRQKRSDFSEDNIIKWLVPFEAGELKVIGYKDGNQVDEYVFNTPGSLSKVALYTSKSELNADGYDVAVICTELLDENDNLITDADQEIKFEITGPAKNIGVDNGWEYNIHSHNANRITTHEGKAILIIQSTQDKGTIEISASCGDIFSKPIELKSRKFRSL